MRYDKEIDNTKIGWIEKFMCRFDLTIALDVMMGNQLPQTYNKALSRTLRSKVFVKRMYGKPIIALTLES